MSEGRLRKVLREKRGWIVGALLVLGFAGWVIFGSETFQACIQGESPDYQDAALYKRVAFVTSAASPGLRQCIGEFVSENGEAITALFTVVLAISTIGLWFKTDQLAKGAEETARRQLRAYVVLGVSGILFNNPKEGQVTAWVRLINSGLTPAYKARASLHFHMGPATDTPFNETKEPGNTTIIGPGGHTNLIGTLDMAPGEVQGIIDKKCAFFVWGRIDYVDIFGDPRFFSFKTKMDGYIDTVLFDSERFEGWGLRSIPDGFDAD